MSKEIVRAGQTYLAHSNDESLRKDAGKALMGVGAGGFGALFVAGLLPFITLPMILVAMVVLGAYLYVR